MINSRETLINYALTNLGAPVIEINVSEEQCSDRLDEALQIMQENHLAGSERTFLKHQITSSHLTLTTNNAGTFLGQPIVTGTTSGATAKIVTFGTTGNNLSIKGISGTFIANETVTAGAITGTLAASNFLTLGDTENGYITLPDAVLSILRILPMSNTAGNGSTNPFDLTYQLRMNDLYNLSSTSVIYYTQVQQHLALINFTLVGDKPIRFNQHMHKLYIDMDWQNYVTPGEYIIVEAYRILDPDAYDNVYNNQWLKKYITALVKRQWGSNLSKLNGVKMPGGVTLNGDKIYEQAINEIGVLHEELQSKWTEPAGFFIG